MNAMTRLVIATIELSDPSALEAWARERLTTHAGFTVFAPDDWEAADTWAVERVQGMNRRFVDADATVFAPGDAVAADAWALDRVRAMGRRVVDADATVLPPERAPAVNSLWLPTRTRAPARLVVSIDGAAVVYQHLGTRSTCALSTWHVWVRRTRAVAS